MPMNKRDYPANWPDISRAIKDAAGWICEWCAIAHGAIRQSAKGRPFREVLTTAHLGVMREDGSPGDKHDKMDCRPENLACLCTRCHLNYDRVDHIRHRRENELRRRLARQLAAGQQYLMEVEA